MLLLGQGPLGNKVHMHFAPLKVECCLSSWGAQLAPPRRERSVCSAPITHTLSHPPPLVSLPSRVWLPALHRLKRPISVFPKLFPLRSDLEGHAPQEC